MYNLDIKLSGHVSLYIYLCTYVGHKTGRGNHGQGEGGLKEVGNRESNETYVMKQKSKWAKGEKQMERMRGFRTRQRGRGMDENKA